MAKKGMRRPGVNEAHGTESNKHNHFPKNDTSPVPELQGKLKILTKSLNQSVMMISCKIVWISILVLG